MRIVAITSPKVMDEDVYLIKALLAKGIDTIHLRKPESDIHACRKILEVLTPEQRAKIIIHDYPELYEEFSLKGIHVNKNVPSLPHDYKGIGPVLAIRWKKSSDTRRNTITSFSVLSSTAYRKSGIVRGSRRKSCWKLRLWVSSTGKSSPWVE